MEEAETSFGFTFQTVPIGTNGFKQVKGADDIGLDEVFRPMNAAVNVRLGGKIDGGTGLVFGEQLGDEVAVNEDVTRVVFQAGEIFEIAGVGKRIKIDDGFVRLG